MKQVGALHISDIALFYTEILEELTALLVFTSVKNKIIIIIKDKNLLLYTHAFFFFPP